MRFRHTIDDDEDYDIDRCLCLRETQSAILVTAPELPDETWIPKSQIRRHSDVHADGDRGTLVIPRWLARDRGII